MNQKVSLTWLVKNYQTTKNESSFNQIYHSVTKKWNVLIARLSERYYLDAAEVESMAHLKLYEIVMTHDNTKGKFSNNLSSAIRRGCIDLVRKKKNIDDLETLVSAKTDEDGNEVNPLEYLASANAEEEIIERLQKNRDQRMLIATLMSNADENTRQCLSAYAETNSFREAAKLLGGTTDKTVKKRIRLLSRHFDGNQNGDYHDYFTVATVNVG